MTDKPKEAREHAELLTFECELDEAPTLVWRALTDPELLAAWLMPNDFKLELGHEFTFRAPDREIACTVLAYEERRLLSLRWREAGEQELDSVVTFALMPIVQGGTRLNITHAFAQRESTLPARVHASPLSFLAIAPLGHDVFRCAA